MKFHIVESSTGFTAYHNDHPVSHERETREKATEDLFQPYAWPGGYDIAYVGDGYAICAACALKAWEDEDEPDHEHIHNGEIDAHVWHADTEDSDGLACDNCNEYIIQPFCAECGDENPSDDLPVFHHDQYSVNVCGACMSRLVRDHEATKTGKGTYRISANSSTAGTYRADWLRG